MRGRRVLTNAIDSLIDGDLPLAVNQAASAAALREYPRAQQISVGRFELKSSIAVDGCVELLTAGATRSSMGTAAIHNARCVYGQLSGQIHN